MRKPTSAFTLIEMMVVMVIIVIVSGLVAGIAGLVNHRSGMTRAAGEMAMISAAINDYKQDTGAVPRNEDTDALKPGGSTPDYDPRKSSYEKASFYLYKEICGDPNANGKPGEKQYLAQFDRKRLLKTEDNPDGSVKKVKYFRDPFGYPYGYSTAAAAAEELFKEDVKKQGDKAERPKSDKVGGYNFASFDLWCTGGNTVSKGALPQDTHATWKTNW